MVTYRSTYFDAVPPRRAVDVATIVFFVMAAVVFTAALYSVAMHPTAEADDMITLTGP